MNVRQVAKALGFPELARRHDIDEKAIFVFLAEKKPAELQKIVESELATQSFEDTDFLFENYEFAPLALAPTALALLKQGAIKEASKKVIEEAQRVYKRAKKKEKEIKKDIKEQLKSEIQKTKEKIETEKETEKDKKKNFTFILIGALALIIVIFLILKK
jgi:predicted nucleic acid-binding Zn ribbon protein